MQELMNQAAGSSRESERGIASDRVCPLDRLCADNPRYWTEQAPRYSQVNQEELSGGQLSMWTTELVDRTGEALDCIPPERILVLDIGCGHGFFSILLAGKGFRVIAADCMQAMLDQARTNAGQVAGRIGFLLMDAEDLPLGDASIDVVVSRNLTWDLPDPERAYAEWLRVLRSGGVLLKLRRQLVPSPV